ncbi:MAG: bifunctional riboflavin kinase/FAD synthetase [Chloroflexota bacterium]|nr:bifunctional riboflavin kinase/FAD synthetase [Chloroflexota bacterium]
MHILRGFDDWPRGPLHLAIGVFDGVHRGHQELIGRLRKGADAQGASAIAITFDPLPVEALAPGAPPSELSEPEERADLLGAAGADAVVVLTFDRRFAETPARDFVARLLAAGDVRRIVVGRDFRFGHDREGDVTLLSVLGGARGVIVDVVPPVERDGAIVSSTRIRNLLVAGDVPAAADLLGRAYSVSGPIVHGDKRGRALGYPTINVATPPRRLLPRDGIYATWVTIAGERRAAATSLGVRPTFGHGERVLESYILDFSGDVYGHDALTTFVERIRDELRFETARELVERIAEDVEATRRALGR